MKNALAASIAPCRQIGDILHMSEGLACKLDEKDRKRDVRRHLLHIDGDCIGCAIVAIPAHYRDQSCRIRKRLLDATRD